MITLKAVSFAYAKDPVLSDFSLTVQDGETVCLFGASGCGKSTVLRLIAGLEKQSAGEIQNDALRIAMVFQEDRLVPWLTVRQNLELVTDDHEAVDRALQEVSLQDDADRTPNELSGGMRRRVALARALCFGGDLLLLDEPFNGLDEALKVQIAHAFRRRFSDRPIVLVTHSPDEARLFDARVIPL